MLNAECFTNRQHLSIDDCPEDTTSNGKVTYEHAIKRRSHSRSMNIDETQLALSCINTDCHER